MTVHQTLSILQHCCLYSIVGTTVTTALLVVIKLLVSYQNVHGNHWMLIAGLPMAYAIPARLKGLPRPLSES